MFTTLGDLSQPTLVARKDEVLASGVTVQGLVTLVFDAPLPTAIGTRYFFGIQTLDPYGIGLRELLSSTYEEGAEAFQQESGVITEHTNGRDLSFQVLGPVSQVVPLPGALWLLGAGFLGYLGLGRRGRNEAAA